MTTPDATAKQPKTGGAFRLPDPPEREPDDMTSFDQLSGNGNAYHLKQHLLAQRPGERDNIIVSGEHYLIARPARNLAGSRYPDLLVAFGADPAAFETSNGYIIKEQGKPPDFVLEIASERTGRIDVGRKREDYERLRIPEYWRFDETGVHHGAKLAGDFLVDGRYQPVAVQELSDGALQGYSAALDLYLRWERGELAWIDPATERRILTLEDERARAENAEVHARQEEEARLQAETRADSERDRADSAEARIRDLEAENRRLRK